MSVTDSAEQDACADIGGGLTTTLTSLGIEAEQDARTGRGSGQDRKLAPIQADACKQEMIQNEDVDALTSGNLSLRI